MADYSRFSSVSDMLSNLNLEIRRQVSSTILFYKIMNNLIEISPDDLTPGLLLPIQEVMTKDFITFM